MSPRSTPPRNAVPHSPPRRKELHPKAVFQTALSLHREEANLSENKENIPPDDEKEDPKHNEPKET